MARLGEPVSAAMVRLLFGPEYEPVSVLNIYDCAPGFGRFCT